jgi:hypothetical protein
LIHISDKLRGAPTGPNFDLVRSACKATSVLFNYLAASGRFGSAPVAVGVARDMREDVPYRPAREQGRTAGVLIREPSDGRHEPLLRLGHAEEVGSGNEGGFAHRRTILATSARRSTWAAQIG